MATTSSRQTSLFGLEDWKKFYTPYATADFASFDYETLRANFVSYIKQQYPETFTDYVESSEYVALLDVMAYMGQALAFRSELNARENFMDTAERRDSVIKLANLVSYSPKRATAAQGLVKVTSVSTTESITDINGNNISNTKILWNDPSNSSWQEQFNTILNAAFVNSQRIGRPGNSQTLLNIKTDEYSINIPTGRLPTVPFQREIDGTVMNFELVSSTSLNQSYLYEISPAPTSQFNILYRNDKLGYGSVNTGFFFYFKQGSLTSLDINFPEKIENNFQQIDVDGINNDDTWLYKMNDQGQITQEWTQVESVYTGTKNSQGENLRPIFSVTSRANDAVTYLFSDGVFGEIPYGLFRSYFRVSNGQQYSISPSEMSGVNASINYISRVGTLETLSLTFSLQTPCNTAQTRESIAAIKERAPARYYTQNRMVNGEDYNNFPFTLYNSIIKSKALNRSSIGISRNLELLDPTGKYSSTNVFATDGALYYDGAANQTTFSTISTVYAAEFLSTTLPVLLASSTSIQYYQQNYTRYAGTAATIGDFYWHQSTVSGSEVTGYFYTIQTNGAVQTEMPIPVGDFSTYTTRYITKGAQLKFTAPPGNYFDTNNRLTTSNTGITSIWVGVLSVIGDGYNFGSGNLSNGAGPITLSAFVPGDTLNSNSEITSVGAALDSILPEFDNTLSNTIVSQALALINLKTDFWLVFDNSLNTTTERWSIVKIKPVAPKIDFVEFIHSSTDDSYTVSIKSLTYKFGSVADVRFLFDSSSRVYDPKSGKVLSDSVNLVKSNGTSTDTKLNITGQSAASDGFVNDFEIVVSSLDSNTGTSANPDFFTDLVGGTTITGAQNAVFFAVMNNGNGMTSLQLLPYNQVVYSSTLVTVNETLYQYSPGQVFYCPSALTLTVTRSGNIVTAVTSTDHRMSIGDTVTITGFLVEDYNGTFVVDTVTATNTFTYTIESNTAAADSTVGSMLNRFYRSSIVPGVTPVVYSLTDVTSKFSVECGKNSIGFQYRRNSSNTTRIDPATTNIIDLYLVTQTYYTNYMNWLADTTDKVAKPLPPTINELQQEYGKLESYKMISDTVIVNSVEFKPLFGSKAESNLQGTIKVIKSPVTTASDSQIRSAVVSAMNSYFSIENWSFGDTLYFSELSAYLHVQLGSLISSVILVPADPTQKFGSLYEIRSAPHQIFCNGATTQDVVVISALTAANMNR